MKGRNESISEDSFELLILQVYSLYLNFGIDIFGLSECTLYIAHITMLFSSINNSIRMFSTSHQRFLSHL